VNEDNLSRGYIALYRSLQDNPIWTQYPPAYLKVFLDCLFRANWKPRKYKFDGAEIDLPVGSFVATSAQIALKVGVTRAATRRALAALETGHMIVTKAATKSTLYTVVNFDIYQNGNKETGLLAATQPASSRPLSGHLDVTKPATNKEIRSKKKEEKSIQNQNLAQTPEALEPEVVPKPETKKRKRDILFDDFWSIVWEKIGKIAAKAEWDRQVKDEAHCRRIIEAAKRQGPRLLAEANARTPRQVLHPRKWLKDGRYDDEGINPLLTGFDDEQILRAAAEEAAKVEKWKREKEEDD